MYVIDFRFYPSQFLWWIIWWLLFLDIVFSPFKTENSLFTHNIGLTCKKNKCIFLVKNFSWVGFFYHSFSPFFTASPISVILVTWTPFFSRYSDWNVSQWTCWMQIFFPSCRKQACTGKSKMLPSAGFSCCRIFLKGRWITIAINKNLMSRNIALQLVTQ